MAARRPPCGREATVGHAVPRQSQPFRRSADADRPYSKDRVGAEKPAVAFAWPERGRCWLVLRLSAPATQSLMSDQPVVEGTGFLLSVDVDVGAPIAPSRRIHPKYRCDGYDGHAVGVSRPIAMIETELSRPAAKIVNELGRIETEDDMLVLIDAKTGDIARSSARLESRTIHLLVKSIASEHSNVVAQAMVRRCRLHRHQTRAHPHSRGQRRAGGENAGRDAPGHHEADDAERRDHGRPGPCSREFRARVRPPRGRFDRPRHEPKRDGRDGRAHRVHQSPLPVPTARTANSSATCPANR